MKKMIVMILVTAALLRVDYNLAMDKIFNYFRLNDNEEHTVSIKNNEIKDDIMLVKDPAEASPEEKFALLLFLIASKKSLYGYGEDFTKLDETKQKEYLEKYVFKYGCINTKIVGMVLFTNTIGNNDDDKAHHEYEIFASSPLYRKVLRETIIQNYENYEEKEIAIEKSISECIQTNKIKTQFEFLKFSIQFLQKKE